MDKGDFQQSVGQLKQPPQLTNIKNRDRYIAPQTLRGLLVPPIKNNLTRQSETKVHHTDSIFDTNQNSVSTHQVSVDYNQSSNLKGPDRSSSVVQMKDKVRRSVDFLGENNNSAKRQGKTGSAGMDPATKHNAGWYASHNRQNLQQSLSLTPFDPKVQGGNGLQGGRSSILAQQSTDLASIITHERNSIGQSYNTNSMQIPTNDSLNKSKMEISKKDLMSFLQNGQVSKSFISKNRQELQNFIKKQKREPAKAQIPAVETLDNNFGFTGPASEDEENGGNSPTKVNNDDVKIHKAFQGETSTITPKVVEQWLNTTLSDAEHMNIPSVLLKPENKVPLTRYGLDRNALLLAGLSNDQVNQMYRSLFVYSVGYFEKLRQILSNASKNDKIQVIKAIWKVFIVLLEYCCRQDYQLMIEQIQAQQHEQISQIRGQYDQQIEDLQNQKFGLNRMLQVKDNQIEMVEKEVRVERQTRSKLEEEYTQMSQNHENEVALRLQFESRLKDLHSAHRKLEIENEKTQHMYDITKSQLDRLEILSKNQSTQLISIREANTENQAKLQVLEEYKIFTSNDLRHKNNMLADAENTKKAALDELELHRNKTKDALNTQKALELSNNDLKAQYKSILTQMKHQESLIIDLRTQLTEKQTKYEDERKNYENLAENSAETLKEYERIKCESSEHTNLIYGLREELERAYMKIEELGGTNVLYKVDYESMRIQLTDKSTDLTQTFEQLKVVNHKRHEYTERYKLQVEENQQLTESNKAQMATIFKLNKELLLLRTEYNKYMEKAEDKEKKLSAEIHTQKEQIKEMKRTIHELKETVELEQKAKQSWILKYNMTKKILDELTKEHDELIVKYDDSERVRIELGNQNSQLRRDKAKFQQLFKEEQKKLKEAEDEVRLEKSKQAAWHNTIKHLQLVHAQELTRLKKQIDDLRQKYTTEKGEWLQINEDHYAGLLNMREQIPKILVADDRIAEAGVREDRADNKTKWHMKNASTYYVELKKIRKYARTIRTKMGTQYKEFVEALIILMEREESRIQELIIKIEIKDGEHSKTVEEFHYKINNLKEIIEELKLKIKQAKEDYDKLEKQRQKEAAIKKKPTQKPIVKQASMKEEPKKEEDQKETPVLDAVKSVEAPLVSKPSTTTRKDPTPLASMDSFHPAQSEHSQKTEPAPSRQSSRKENMLVTKSSMKQETHRTQDEIVEKLSEIADSVHSVIVEKEIKKPDLIKPEEMRELIENVKKHKAKPESSAGSMSGDENEFDNLEQEALWKSEKPESDESEEEEAESSQGYISASQDEDEEEEDGYKEWRRLRHIPADEKNEKCFSVYLEYTQELDNRVLTYLYTKLDKDQYPNIDDLEQPKFKKIPGMFRLLKLTDQQKQQVKDQRLNDAKEFIQLHPELLEETHELLRGPDRERALKLQKKDMLNELAKFSLTSKYTLDVKHDEEGNEVESPQMEKLFEPAKVLETQFLRFAHNHFDALDSRFQLDRRLKRAQIRQPDPVKLVVEEVPNQISGQTEYSQLIQMSKITKDEYAEHRALFFNGLKSAHKDLSTGEMFTKDHALSKDEQLAIQRQDKDLRLHKAIMAKMIIERPHLNHADAGLPRHIMHPKHVQDLQHIHRQDLNDEEMDTASSGSYLAEEFKRAIVDDQGYRLPQHLVEIPPKNMRIQRRSTTTDMHEGSIEINDDQITQSEQDNNDLAVGPDGQMVLTEEQAIILQKHGLFQPTGKSESVSTLLEQVRQLDQANLEKTAAIESSIQGFVIGGTAGVHNEFLKISKRQEDRSRSPKTKDKKVKGSSNIRTMIRAADSRYE